MYLLNFHHVEPSVSHEERRWITITPEGLRRFIRVIRRFGLEPVSLREVLRDGVEAYSSRHVVITFDDGFENFHQYAVPVLKAENCPATMFALGGKFGGTNDWDQSNLPVEQRDKLMTLEQMRELGECELITFGSHGLQHRNLAQIDPIEMKLEIMDSHEILSRELGDAYLPVMAYPWGSYSNAVQEAMKDSPFQYGFTTEKGEWNADASPYAIPRYSAYFRDGNPLVLIAKLLKYRLGVFDGGRHSAARRAAVLSL